MNARVNDGENLQGRTVQSCWPSLEHLNYSCLQQARPRTELALPYGSYRLVAEQGAPVERLNKHPFCMARVYYDAKEKPQEVWAEMSDGSCRWRQTGSEVKVIALKVRLPATVRTEHAVTAGRMQCMPPLGLTSACMQYCTYRTASDRAWSSSAAYEAVNGGA